MEKNVYKRHNGPALFIFYLFFLRTSLPLYLKPFITFFVGLAYILLLWSLPKGCTSDHTVRVKTFPNIIQVGGGSPENWYLWDAEYLLKGLRLNTIQTWQMKNILVRPSWATERKYWFLHKNYNWGQRRWCKHMNTDEDYWVVLFSRQVLFSCWWKWFYKVFTVRLFFFFIFLCMCLIL